MHAHGPTVAQVASSLRPSALKALPAQPDRSGYTPVLYRPLTSRSRAHRSCPTPWSLVATQGRTPRGPPLDPHPEPSAREAPVRRVVSLLRAVATLQVLRHHSLGPSGHLFSKHPFPYTPRRQDLLLERPDTRCADSIAESRSIAGGLSSRHDAEAACVVPAQAPPGLHTLARICRPRASCPLATVARLPTWAR